MSYLVKEIPITERPRERLIKYGPSSLANHELLAIILRTGTKNISAIDLAKNILNIYQDLDKLNEATIEELSNIRGIGITKSIELLAAIEIGKRISVPNKLKTSITSPIDSYKYLKNRMQHLNQENLIALFLNTKSEIIAEKTITVGTLNHTLFHPRDILKWALKFSAAAIIIAHNHPSGDPVPSKNDLEVTNNLIKAAKTVDLIIVDHIIIGKNCYYSMLDHKKVF